MRKLPVMFAIVAALSIPVAGSTAFAQERLPESEAASRSEDDTPWGLLGLLGLAGLMGLRRREEHHARRPAETRI